MSSWSLHRSFLAVAAAVLLSSCGAAPAATSRDVAALDGVTSAVMGMPLTTSSADAREAYLQGLREIDLARPFDALEHFKAAVARDSNFALAYLAIANSGNSRAEYTRGHELNPRDAGMLQQRGHVNSFGGDYAAARADYDSAMALGRGNEKGFFAPFRAYVSAYAGDAGGAITELNKLVTDVDGMGIPEPRGTKINALSNVALIAIHTKDFYAADAALKARTPLMMQQADQVGSPAFRRAQQANIAYFEAWLAARRGDYGAAQIAADRMAALVAPDANPRKMEPYHQLKGFIALYQGNSKEAAAHFAEGNLQDPYIEYNYAVALEGSGQAAKAKPMFQALAVYNFNSLGYALIRKDAQQKAS